MSHVHCVLPKFVQSVYLIHLYKDNLIVLVQMNKVNTLYKDNLIAYEFNISSKGTLLSNAMGGGGSHTFP